VVNTSRLERPVVLDKFVESWRANGANWRSRDVLGACMKGTPRGTFLNNMTNGERSDAKGDK
jgi:hypothetical protein